MCGYTGYGGRIAVQEVLSMDGGVAEAVMGGAKAEDLEAVAMKCGMVTMRQDGIEKAMSGELELAELMRLF